MAVKKEGLAQRT